jgi:hypothetical protein
MSYLEDNCVSIEVADVLIGKLKRVKSGNIRIAGVGICGNWNWSVEEELGEDAIHCYGLVEELAIGWPEHSGSTTMPIRHNNDYQLWEGPNMVARQSLCNYILEQLEAHRRTL